MARQRKGGGGALLLGGGRGDSRRHRVSKLHGLSGHKPGSICIGRFTLHAGKIRLPIFFRATRHDERPGNEPTNRVVEIGTRVGRHSRLLEQSLRGY